MKALQNYNWRPVTGPRLLIVPVPPSLFCFLVSLFSFIFPFLFSFFFFFSFLSLPPCFPSFPFPVLFIWWKTKPASQTKSPTQYPKTCYTAKSWNRLVMTQARWLQYKHLLNSIIFWLKKASVRPDSSKRSSDCHFSFRVYHHNFI